MAKKTEQTDDRSIKFPELWNLFQELQAEKEALRSKSQPIRDKRDKLQEKLQPIEDEMRELAKQFKAIEGTRMFELDQQIGAIARAMGGKTMSGGQAEAAARGEPVEGSQ